MKKINTVLVLAAAALAFSRPASAEDAYIESDGSVGAGINTGFFVGPQTKIEIDFQLTTNSQNQVRLFGAKGVNGDDSTPECECYIGKNTSSTECFSFICGASGGTRQSSNFKAIDTQRHRIVLDFHEAKEFQVWTGDSKNAKALSAYPANRQKYPLTFFCKTYTTLAMYSSRVSCFDYYAKMRVYRFRIWDAGVLVRDYVPRVKGGVAGFYETCSEQFVMGENIAAFSAGGDVTREKDDPYVAMPDNDVMTASGVSGKSLYFDTGYVFTPKSRVELDYALLTPTWTTNSLWKAEALLLFAQGPQQLLYLMAYGKNIEGRYYRKFGETYEGGIVGTGLNTAYGVRRMVSMDKKYLRIITAGYTNYSDSASAANVISQNLSSATLRIGGRTSNSFTPMRIYGLKIFETENGVETLVRNYEPVISNSVPRLVDTLNVSNKSIPTVYGSGTGTSAIDIVFDAGGDIKGDDAAGEAYLDFDGVNGHAINTEYVLTKDSRVEADFAVWNTKYNNQQYLFEQRGYVSDSSGNGVWFRLYLTSGACYGWSFCDYYIASNGSHGNLGWTTASFDNERVKFVFDAPNNHATAHKGGQLVWETTDMARTKTLTWETCTSPLWIGSNWSGNSNATGMRLYSLKIYKSGSLDRNYVPCVHNGQAGLYELCQNRFFPLTGGKVRGATLAGQTFQISPQPAKLSHEDGENTTTLTCIAAGAQSYEWYEDEKKLAGETGDSLLVTWKRGKPYSHIYSVVPVYTVFNETVRGESAQATVEMTPLGITVIIQ